MTYPDPDQLIDWAKEPMPFTEMEFNDDLTDDGYVIGVSHLDETTVEYSFRPTDMIIETEPDERRPAYKTELTHGQAWCMAIDIEIGEDFICVTNIVDENQFDAYWVLESVTVSRKS